ncbi:MAG: MerC domain-containing protein [Rhizobiales bacterium TMED168]|nr:MAG: MerC domain-containing protein [Rhizobiales bacterium TMED168]|tara:strand:- start:413 stop:823 length:411 start_codon:yes stop_codon:yes gene_type:complete
MFAQLINAQKVSDIVSIGISLLCVMHCLLFPLFLILSSNYLTLFLNNELFHYTLLFLIVPLSLFALTIGLKNHNSFNIFIFGFIGIIFLLSALFFDIKILFVSSEIFLTILGSSFMMIAHYKNFQLCRHLDCDCHE